MRKLFFTLLIFVLFVTAVPYAGAEGAFLYLSPSSGSFLVGSTFTISIFLDTGGKNINTVWADLKFPPEILQITSPTAGTSFISEWIVPPNYSNERGIVSFKGGVPGGIVTSAGLVSSITFRAVSSGEAKIEFTGDSRILLHDGKGTDILTNVIDGEYRVLVPPPEGPKVFSPTHPNPDVWYPDSSPAFSWEKEKGVTDFSWLFDQNPKGRPDGISEGAGTMVSFAETKNGLWYFHIRQRKDGIWGKTTHASVRIDSTPPNDFSPRVETYSRLVGYQIMVYFDTKDSLSGISRYEISIMDLSTSPPNQAFFTEVTSPYKVPFQKASKYVAVVRAIDKSGNIKEGEVRFRLMTPLITHIEDRGLEIRGIFFPWWLLFVLLIVFVGELGTGVWLFTKRRKEKRDRVQKRKEEAQEAEEHEAFLQLTKK